MSRVWYGIALAFASPTLLLAQPTPVPAPLIMPEQQLVITRSPYPKFPTTNRLLITGEGGCAITIDMRQGTVVLDPKCKPDEASRLFWESLDNAFPYLRSPTRP